MPFFFPKAMAARALSILKNNPSGFRENEEYSGDCYLKKQNVKRSRDAYDLFCHQYFGLGYVLSFFPGCQAFKARRILSKEVNEFSQLLQNNQFNPNLESNTIFFTTRWPITGSILRLPFEIKNLIKDAFEPFTNNDVKVNKKEFVKDILTSYLPILKDIYNKEWGDLFHTLCNPVRLVEDTLTFLNKGINRLIESGSEYGSNSGPVRTVLKGVVGFIFSAIKVPVKIVSVITDLPYQVVKHGIYEPFQFFKEAWKKRNENEDGIITKQETAERIEGWMGHGLSITPLRTTGKVLDSIRGNEPEEEVTPREETTSKKNVVLVTATFSEVELMKKLASIANSNNHRKYPTEADKDAAATTAKRRVNKKMSRSNVGEL